MPQIETDRSDVTALKGLHLWHFATSSCSQRVRLTLYEKGQSWHSSHVDLSRNEHLSPNFIALNPAMLVPVLVHDGRVYVDSNDIITYLDSTFPEPPLLPETEAERQDVLDVAACSEGAQDSLKLLSYEFLFKPKAIMPPAKLADYTAGCPNPKLVKFHTEFSEGSGFSEHRIREAVATMDAAFLTLEQRLAHALWLSGEHFGLADIAWLVNVHRMSLMRFSFARYPMLNAWLARCVQRPGTKRAILAFEKRPIRIFFWMYSLMRAMARSSVNHYR